MRKLYFAIVDKVYALSYLNVGTPSQFRLPDYYIIKNGFKSNSILYTSKEIKVIKLLHPNAEIIAYEDIDAHFYKHSAFFRLQQMELKQQALIEYQLKNFQNLN